MSRVILDTDVASLLFKDRLPGAFYAKIAGRQLGITYVTVGELAKWTVTRRWDASRRTALEDWMSALPTPPAGTPVARKWGEIVAYAERRGRPRPVNDSWVAACCLADDLPLATLNVADFRDVADDEGLRLVSA